MTSKFDSIPGPNGGPGPLLDDGVSVVVGGVVETLPGKAPSVACHLEGIDGLEVVGGDGDRRLAIVWCAASAKTIEKAMEQLIKDDEDILGIFPTFMGQDDGGNEAQAREGAVKRLVDDEKV